MIKAISLKETMKTVGLILLLTTPLGISEVSAEEELIGSDEFRTSCISCHGVGGKGDGPMAKFLTVKPADLTQLAKNNGGDYPTKPGEFPFYRVFKIIDGRTLVSAHGDRAMPIWGNRYKMEAGDKYGPMGGEQMIRARILELVYYLQMIQER
ncbi:cytochrome c [Pontibacterium sp.]|jgi:mono/diheme cytochrome c family protein|uniref:c-type cytochrome n=1 Tax=Pontibacterium sp. TaxID=2036026 RepID=UPI003566798E